MQKQAADWRHLKPMQGHKQPAAKVVLRFRLSERVPAHSFCRRLRQLPAWEFVREQTRSVYSPTGQPSLDLVVLLKFMLVGRLANIVSGRRSIEQCALRLDILYFLGYEVDEDLPWHSTNRRSHRLHSAAVFEHLFDQVFTQRVAAKITLMHQPEHFPARADLIPVSSLLPGKIPRRAQLPAEPKIALISRASL